MKKKANNIGFALSKVSTEQFAIIEDGFNDKGKLGLNTSLRFAADKKQRYLAVFALFTFYSDENPFLVIEAGCHFPIREAAWKEMIDSESETLTVPRGFLCHLAMLTVGTTRGILHAKTEGTCFNKYIIPTVDVTEIIREDGSFRLDRE